MCASKNGLAKNKSTGRPRSGRPADERSKLSETITVSNPEESSSFCLQTVLGKFDQFSESNRIGGSDVSQSFAIQVNFGDFQPFNETTVGNPSGACGCVDTDLLKAAELTLLVTTITVGIDSAVIQSICRIAV